MNLYGFVGNDGVGKWDLLGMDPVGDRIWNAYILQAGAIPFGLDLQTLSFFDGSGTMMDLTADDADNYYRYKAMLWDSQGKIANDNTWWGFYIFPREPTNREFNIPADGWVHDAGFWLATAKETSAKGLLFVRKCNNSLEVHRGKSKIGFTWKDIIDTNPTPGQSYYRLERFWQLPEAAFALEIVIQINYVENRSDILKVL